MKLPKELLNILICPQSHAKLEQVGERLECQESQFSYPIIDGIPILLIEEAKPIA